MALAIFGSDLDSASLKKPGNSGLRAGAATFLFAATFFAGLALAFTFAVFFAVFFAGFFTDFFAMCVSSSTVAIR